MAKVEFKNYSVYHKIKREWYLALENVNLCIDPGELVLVTGSSGSGKTTLLRSVLGMAEKTTGTLLLDGRDIREVQVTQQNIGYVSQEYALYPSMTVYENIAYPLTIQQIPVQELKEKARIAAELVGLGALLTRRPRQLSGGQQQRLALARALVKQPQLLLLDEPFSNLPAATKDDLYTIVNRYHKVSGATILFVTHDLQEALPLADRVVELEEGRIIRDAAATPVHMGLTLATPQKKEVPDAVSQ